MTDAAGSTDGPTSRLSMMDDACWVRPPPTNSGILGIYKDLNLITIISCGHYKWVGAQPKTYGMICGMKEL